MPKPKPGTKKKPKGIEIPHRHPGGHVEAQEERGKAPALVKRIMDHAVALGADARCATVLGRMHLEGVITETEFAAGLLYAEDVGAWERIKGHPRRAARSPSFDSGFGRADVDLEALERMDPEAADKVKRRIARQNRRIIKRYEKAQNEIPHLPILLSTLIEQVCCNDMPVMAVHHPAVKAMLSNLARNCYRLNDASARAPKAKAKPVTRQDIKDLAEATVEAMEQWFRKRGAAVAFYRVQKRHELQARAISAYGMTGDGTKIENTIKLKRPAGSRGEAIDQALLAAAEAKGWAAMRAASINEIDAGALAAAVAKLKGEAA